MENKKPNMYLVVGVVLLVPIALYQVIFTIAATEAREDYIEDEYAKLNAQKSTINSLYDAIRSRAMGW